jgi:hypothetical protein
MHDLAVVRKQARQTRSFPRLGPRRACAVAFERTLRWNSFGNPFKEIIHVLLLATRQRLKGFVEICNDLGKLPADNVDIHAVS